MRPNDRTWLTYIVAFAAPLIALGVAVLRQVQARRRSPG